MGRWNHSLFSSRSTYGRGHESVMRWSQYWTISRSSDFPRYAYVCRSDTHRQQNFFIPLQITLNCSSSFFNTHQLRYPLLRVWRWYERVIRTYDSWSVTVTVTYTHGGRQTCRMPLSCRLDRAAARPRTANLRGVRTRTTSTGRARWPPPPTSRWTRDTRAPARHIACRSRRSTRISHTFYWRITDWRIVDWRRLATANRSRVRIRGRPP